MNTPNKLTIARIIATPFFMAALMIEFPFHYTVALILFIAASLTDMIDGKMARKYNMITDFGKFLDPLADKMLTTAAFLGFIKMGIGWQVTWIAFIVLGVFDFFTSPCRGFKRRKGNCGQYVGQVQDGKPDGGNYICAVSLCAYIRFRYKQCGFCFRLQCNNQYTFLGFRRIMYYIGSNLSDGQQGVYRSVKIGGYSFV